MDSADWSCNHTARNMLKTLVRSWERRGFADIRARSQLLMTVLALCFAGCRNNHSNQSPEETTPPESSFRSDHSSPTPSQPPVEPPRPTSPLSLPPLPSANHPFLGQAWASCFHGFRTSNHPHRDVTRLALLCAPYQGMMRAGRTLFRTVREGEDAHLDVRLAASQCARVFVVGDDGLKSFHVITSDPRGNALAIVRSTSGFAVVSPDGAWCAAKTGEYRTRIVIDDGAGTVAAEAWTLPVP